MRNNNFLWALVALSTGILIFSACSQSKEQEYQYPFLNPELSVEKRANDLVSRLTVEQKISQMRYDAPAIDSLHIPAYNWWNEALHGVARSGLATVYPQAIGLAATWDKQLMHEVATSISTEARAKYHDYIEKDKHGIYQGLTFWSPNINIFRDPRWGRGMETYGEDPYLTGKMATQFIKGMQGDHPKYLKTVATAKHYAVHNGPEPLRHEFNAVVNEYDLHETYLPAFKRCIREANVHSVMCAYNAFKGDPCCGNPPLLKDILRDQWNFDGYVVSDCWAINDFYDGHNVVETQPEAAAMAVKSGTDLNCGNSYPSLTKAIQKGLIQEKEIDTAVKRLMKARIQLGMFDPSEKDPYSDIPYKKVDCKEHQKLALEAARKSVVLLKNNNQTLPLNKKAIKKIAVIGPNADNRNVLLANYHGIPSDPVTLLEGIKNKVSDKQVLYAKGCKLAQNLPALQPIPSSALYTSPDKEKNGLKVAYYDNHEFEGEPVKTGINKNIDFYWWDKAPLKQLNEDDFGVKWSGVIVPPKTGTYAIGGKGYLQYKIHLNDSLLIDYNNIHESNKVYEFVKLKANKAYDIEIAYGDTIGEAEMRLLWEVPGQNLQKEALRKAKKADVVLLNMGLSPRLEGEEMKVNVKGFEGGDRVTIGLPEIQKDFLKKIYQLNKPTVLVLFNGSALSINKQDQNIPAILEAWYPGQEGGTAIADILFGDYNPAGRLPLTFYQSVDQLPPFKDYSMENRTYKYFEEDPLYAFGYGLSYTNFSYSKPHVSKEQIKNTDSVQITSTIENTGDLKGEEVVQLYLQYPETQYPKPQKELIGFKRIEIQAGETKKVSFKIDKDQLSFWNKEADAFTVTPGQYKLMIGSSSRNQDLLSQTLEVIE